MSDRQQRFDAQQLEDDNPETKLERFLAIPSDWDGWGDDERFDRAMSGDFSPTAAALEHRYNDDETGATDTEPGDPDD